MKIYLYRLSSYRTFVDSPKHILVDMYIPNLGEKIDIYTENGKCVSIQSWGEGYRRLGKPFTRELWYEIVSNVKKYTEQK